MGDSLLYHDGSRTLQDAFQSRAIADRLEAVTTHTRFTDHDRAFMEAKVATARFYAEHLLVRLPALRDSIVEGADAALGLELEAF